MQRFLGSIVVAGVALTAAAAFARDSQIVVSYADLNLSAPAGKAVLIQRINFAAIRVCGSQPFGPVGMLEAANFNRCVNEATSRAMQSLPDDVAAELGAHELRTASAGR